MLRGLSVQEILAIKPWTFEQLNEAYFTDWVKTRKALEEFEGFLIWSELESLDLSFNIFLDSVRDMFTSINQFRFDSGNDEFWHRTNMNIFENCIIRVHRGIFSTITTALSLVDHSRRFNDKFYVTDYQERVDKDFSNSEDHLFIKGLRNYISHRKLSQANWTITYNKEFGKEVVFLLSKDELLQSSKWSAKARYYIEQNVQINIEELFKQYQKKVREFHEWHHSAVIQRYGEVISEYLKYERYLNQVQTQCEWNVFLSQIFIPRDLDPYQYLGRFLSKDHLKEILSFPNRSKEQVDRIIDFVDINKACTEEIRQKLYQLFKVTN